MRRNTIGHFGKMILTVAALWLCREVRAEEERSEAERLYYKALSYEHSGISKKRVIETYKQSAEMGWPDAQVKMASLYNRGEGVEQDTARALALYHSAAQKGHPDAQYIMGEAFLNGNGVEKDIKQATEFFRLSAAQDNGEAQTKLDAIRAQGLAAAETREERIAREAREDCAKGLMLLKQKAYGEGMRHIKRAADAENAEAEYMIGRGYGSGDYGLTKDVNQARHWLERALAHGHDNAETVLEMLGERQANDVFGKAVALGAKVTGTDSDDDEAVARAIEAYEVVTKTAGVVAWQKATAYVNIGAVRIQGDGWNNSGNLDSAVASFNKALAVVGISDDVRTKAETLKRQTKARIAELEAMANQPVMVAATHQRDYVGMGYAAPPAMPPPVTGGMSPMGMVQPMAPMQMGMAPQTMGQPIAPMPMGMAPQSMLQGNLQMLMMMTQYRMLQSNMQHDENMRRFTAGALQRSANEQEMRDLVDNVAKNLADANASGDEKAIQEAQALSDQLTLMLQQRLSMATQNSLQIQTENMQFLNNSQRESDARFKAQDAQFKAERRDVYERNLQGAHDNRVRVQNDTSGALTPSMQMEAKRLERQAERDARDAGYRIQHVYPE